MKTAERRSMWHHAVFSGVLCIGLLTLVVIRRDIPGLLLAGFFAAYIGGNTALHYRRKDFQTETFFEYLLVGAAVLIVLVGAIRH